ncbi:hypothetical protein ACWCY6_44510 [Streptomyces sp. 900105755]
METDFPGLTADVNVSGDGLVRLGSIRPEAALMLAELIVSGLTAETASHVDTTAEGAMAARRSPSAAA